MTTVYNPYLPSYEYVPDGEPHVFGDRLYVFGSHDAFGADAFCVNNYVCYSAPLDDLGAWRFDGYIFDKATDPLNPNNEMYMNAPDVCQGPDGRYYLYYQLHRLPVTSVAVAEKPEGPYTFYGHVKHPDGTLYGKVPGDAFNFDPGMLVDDDGRVYMYTGFSPSAGMMRTVMTRMGVKLDGGTVVELEADMLTLKGEPKATVPGELFAADTGFEGHGFYEASSPRKIGRRYYLVYSSILSHELCYAVSDSPMGTWHYGGTIVSIGDIGLPGVSETFARNFTGNTHGGLVEVKGQWYVFYHRQTNQQMCARQGCAERITILPDGSIPQAEITSCGLNDGPLPAQGSFEARIACNLWGKKGTFAYKQPHHSEPDYPYFTQTGADREENGDQYIANMTDGSTAGFKYFAFDGKEIGFTVTARGTAEGNLAVGLKADKEPIVRIPVHPADSWQSFHTVLPAVEGTHALYLRFEGQGGLDLNTICFG